MSQAELPEDPELWPVDPYQLLGVEPGAEAVVIKRAYTRLIRRFKPEHFPAQFIRLRQAYEQIRDEGANELPVQVDRSQMESIDPSLNSFGHAQAAGMSATHGEVWRLAATGQFEQALDLLRSHLWPYEQRANISLTEYWITKLQVPPHDVTASARVLLRNLHRYCRVPELLTLAEQELELHPELTSEIDFALCTQGLLNLAELTELVRLRWQPALRTEQFELIADDWRMLGAMHLDNRQLHSAIALLAVDYLVWASEEKHRAQADELIRDLEHSLGLDHSKLEQLERIERLAGMVSEWHTLRQQHACCETESNWLPLMWVEDFVGYQTPVTEWLSGAIGDSTRALAFFDALEPHDELFQFVLAKLQAVVHVINQRSDPEGAHVRIALSLRRHAVDPSPLECEQIEEFLAHYDNEPYELYRVKLARFSVEENVAPQRIMGYIKASNSIIARFMHIEILERIQQDDSLLWLTQILRALKY